MKSHSCLWGGLAWLAAASVWAQDSDREARPPVLSRSVTGPLAKDLVLDPPAIATVIKLDSLLVRSQPAFAGDILAHVQKGQSVTVLEQIALAKPKLNEPTNWARIVLPTNAAVWVFADYIDTNSMTVSARRLNVRGGPDDVHDVVARLEKGAPIKEVRRQPGWIQIEPPTNAYGWVASDYLTMPPPTAPLPAAVAAAEPAVPAPAAAAPVAAAPVTNEPVAAAPATNAPVAAAPVTPEPVALPATNSTPATTNATPATAAAPPIVAPEPVATTPPAAPTNAAPPAAVPAEAAPPPAAAPAIASVDIKPRLATREGYVRKALNVQAPADFELRDINSGALIEYLQPDAKDMNFKKYTGTRVSVTGPEWLDRRWPKTPILRVQTVDLMP